MRSLDTNMRARFYCDDPHDPQAERQRPVARRIVLESPSLYVPLSVVLELEWIMRGFYRIERDGVCAVIGRLRHARPASGVALIARGRRTCTLARHG
ncbi:MAG: hypothetical protein U1E89_13245 [Burkholderiaceae bacterium]